MGRAWVAVAEPHVVGDVVFRADSTNPATAYGYGTWVQIAVGQFIVGQNGADTDFDTALETGGAKTHTHGVGSFAVGAVAASTDADGAALVGAAAVATSIHTHPAPAFSGTSAAGSTLPPYCVLYVWRRSA